MLQVMWVIPAAPIFFYVTYPKYHSITDNLWKRFFEGLEGGGMGNKAKGRGQWGVSCWLIMAYAVHVLCLDTYNIYVSIGSWHFSKFNAKIWNMAAWYLANSPPKGACMLTRVFVHRLVVDNFKSFICLLAQSRVTRVGILRLVRKTVYGTIE